MSGQHKYRLWRVPSVVVKCIEGMWMNVQYVRGRLSVWKIEQQFKAAWARDHPEKRKIIRSYPFRYPLTISILKLYKSTVRDVRRGLGRWYNPWIMVPPCSFGLTMNVLGSYSVYRHEIVISETFKYWRRQIAIFRSPLEAAMRLSRRGKHQTVSWGLLGESMMRRAASHKELYAEVEEADRFSELDEVWQEFIQGLPPILEECASAGVLSDDLMLWYGSLVNLQSEFHQLLRGTFVHELIHAWTRWSEYREARSWYRLLSFQEYQKVEEEERGFTVYKAVNEALTEWITQRMCADLYGGYSTRFDWRGVVYGSSYAVWIIEYVAQALEYHWDRVVCMVPSLAQWDIQNVGDLLYAACFSGPQLIQYFKEALVVMCGDTDAFEKISQACERFTQRPECEEGLLQESLDDLRDLLAPFIAKVIPIDDSPSEGDKE